MLAFREEAHVDRWCQQHRIAKGGVLTLDQVWQLGRTWYEEKMSPEWKRATPEEAEAAFAGIGLTRDFWRLR
jgi:Alkylmercury lyase